MTDSSASVLAPVETDVIVIGGGPAGSTASTLSPSKATKCGSSSASIFRGSISASR